MPTMRPENVARCLDNFKKQTYPDKELVLILNNAEFDLDSIRREAKLIPNVRVLHVDGRTTLGHCLNRGVEAASGKYVAKMDDDDYYGERYLSDSLLAASFSDAEIVGKGLFYVYFETGDITALLERTSEHTFMSFVTGGTLLVRKEVAEDIGFDSVSVRKTRTSSAPQHRPDTGYTRQIASISYGRGQVGCPTIPIRLRTPSF